MGWIPVTRFLMEEVSEWYGALFLIYRCLVGFAVMKVITGIFMHETFKVASQDDELMVLQKERQAKKHVQKMMQLMHHGDDSGDDKLSFSEFKDITTDPRVSTWLSAMEFDIRDPELVFSLIDDSDDGTITAQELIAGVSRLKGPARSMDLATLTHEHRRIVEMIEIIHQHLVGPIPRVRGPSAVIK